MVIFLQVIGQKCADHLEDNSVTFISLQSNNICISHFSHSKHDFCTTSANLSVPRDPLTLPRPFQIVQNSVADYLHNLGHTSPIPRRCPFQLSSPISQPVVALLPQHPPMIRIAHQSPALLPPSLVPDPTLPPPPQTSPSQVT